MVAFKAYTSRSSSINRCTHIPLQDSSSTPSSMDAPVMLPFRQRPKFARDFGFLKKCPTPPTATVTAITPLWHCHHYFPGVFQSTKNTPHILPDSTQHPPAHSSSSQVQEKAPDKSQSSLGPKSVRIFNQKNSLPSLKQNNLTQIQSLTIPSNKGHPRAVIKIPPPLYNLSSLLHLVLPTSSIFTQGINPDQRLLFTAVHLSGKTIVDFLGDSGH